MKQFNLETELKRAQRDWQKALTFFNETWEVDLIDYAIFNLKAAEEYYFYLRGLVREEMRK